MRNDADFAAYFTARWPLLVRTLVLLGSARREAEELARTGLAHCYAEWDRVLEADDVDAHVYRAVLECWHKALSHRGREEAPEVLLEADTGGDLSDQVLLRQALQAQLGRLDAEHREPVVLRFVADLTERQVAEVLDVPVGTVRSRVSSALADLDLVALREMTG
jgi:DNA-directed RNA polymerase specialized sigma24 family protein